MHRPIPVIYFFLLTILPAIAIAQGTQADYDRANSLRESTRKTVFRRKVEPNWSADEIRLWYRIEVAPSKFEFVIVDAAAGTREPAFDSVELAKKLADATRKAVDARRLPFQRLTIVDKADAVEFSAFSGVWQYDRSNKELSRLRDAEAPNSKSDKKDSRGQPGSNREDRGTPKGRKSPDGKWVVFEKSHDLYVKSEESADAEDVELGKAGPGEDWYSDRYISW